MRIELVAALCAAGVLADCASVTRGTTEPVQFSSDPSGAEARTSLGYTCITPCIAQLRRSDTFGVIFEKAGYRKKQVIVRNTVAGEGAAAFAGNVVLGGAVGMVADVATGASMDHCPNPVSVKLQPLKANEQNVLMEISDPCEPAELAPSHSTSRGF
jgi:hypothetical protein